ncbi:MAG: ribosome-associated ATPase/putative transporter RbbA [Betaproteobacteria bacterium]|nr:ribosome-associated ATPase/putative transporter RbbA [Betaproteobacteria bacterium]
MPAGPLLARFHEVGLRYAGREVLELPDLCLPAGAMVGLIGPDGVGKSSLLALLCGARSLQRGDIEVLGGSLRDAHHLTHLRHRVAYMPQGLGRSLYGGLSVAENLEFFGRQRGFARVWREQRARELLRATGLEEFARRPAATLSGGMKQKLALCCALLHDPELLVLDEPTTGVDPLSRVQFWALIRAIREQRAGGGSLSVVVATAYMDEARDFDWLVAMNAGRVVADGSPAALLARSGCADLEQAFVALVGAGPRDQAPPPALPPPLEGGAPVVEARELSRRFGDFTAVDRIDLSVRRGEIFGFIGSNGCGKTTTMKMLTGLLEPSGGSVRVLGRTPDARDLATRKRVGYMTQGFSLWNELSVRQNLELHARLFGLPASRRAAAVEQAAARFELQEVMDRLAARLPLGQRQRLSFAVATLHGPELLILDEPTSGVDPLAREWFWRQMQTLARRDGVTVFVSTHRMSEAQRCDRIALMHAGRVLASGTPEELTRARGAASLEQAFVEWIEASRAQTPGGARGSGPGPAPGAPGPRQASGAPPTQRPAQAPERAPAAAAQPRRRPPLLQRSLTRLFSHSWRESLELLRDPVRASLALLGSVLLLVIMGYGINLDVQHLRFAVLDRDDSSLSRDYVRYFASAREFSERAPLRSDADMRRRLRDGELALALEIPPHFGRDLQRGLSPEVGAWVDGSMPARAETVDGFVQAVHASWLARLAAERGPAGMPAQPAGIEIRYRYNPDVSSLVAMVPAIIPLLLIMIPAMLAALSVVREKELGSILNFYVGPATRLEFLLGKQLPYVALALLNAAVLWAWARWVFGVPFRGSAAAFALGTLLYVIDATALGLLMSSFLRTQTASIFATTIGTVLPAVQFSGLLDPTSSLQGLAAWVGRVYPTTHYLIVSRGTFSKGLGPADLWPQMLALALGAPVLLGAGVLLLRRQER